mgnify:CR=1 FL=1
MAEIAPTSAASGRLLSLDVFRGATIAAMILVNNPGDWGNVYWPLLHVPWHGWTPTDLIFPFFLFIVGAAIPFGSADGRSWSRILRRSAAIIGLGFWHLARVAFDILAEMGARSSVRGKRIGLSHCLHF